MNSGMNLSLRTDPNGTVTLSNERMTLTIQQDGTIFIASEDPVQLTGVSLAKLDRAGIDPGPIQSALASRLYRRP